MNGKDIFKEQLKSVFDGFEVQAPQDSWKKIEQTLNAAVRAKVVRRSWYIGSAAAVFVLLIGSLFFLKTPQLTKADVPVFSEVVVQRKQASSEIEDIGIKINAPIQTQKSPRTINLRPIPFVKQKMPQVTVHIKETIVPEDKAPETKESQSQTIKETAPQPNREEIENLLREFARAGEGGAFDDFELRSRKKDKPITLALNAKCGLISSQKTVNTPMTLRGTSANKSEPDIYTNITDKNGMLMMNAEGNTGDNIAEMEHLQPFSVGVTVSKEIFDNFSVETGLVYTYLFSKAKNTNPNFRNRETQHLHYIGVPLTFNYNLFSIGKLDVYASTGGMVEKAVYGTRQLRSRSEFDITNSINRETESETIRQENLQYSVNVGAGISYPLISRLNLYGKVGGAYYFDAKNSASTIYSEKKILLDLNIGLRFDF